MLLLLPPLGPDEPAPDGRSFLPVVDVDVNV